MSRISLEAPPPKQAPVVNSKDNIAVVCRFRPQNKREDENGGKRIVEVLANGQAVKIVTREDGLNTFTFDRVFDSDVSQLEVYHGAAHAIVESVMDGYNGTIFAYGQTGSGKTFSMEGPSIDDPERMGIIPRMVTHVFDLMGRAPVHIEFTAKVSMVEIYLEHIRDLLDTSKTSLSVHEDRVRGVYIEDATEEYVSAPQEVYDVMKYGASLRATAATCMNAESSRSHSIFMMEIKQRDTKTESVKTGKLFLVDLAGSEKVRKTGASGDRLEEAKTINRSLAALGNVINALTDIRNTHVPYRDSKLTRILQQSLGGNSRTCLVLACSPSSWNEQETLSTLRFGSRAKLIKNKATVNQEFTSAQLKLMLTEANTEIDRLRTQLAASGVLTTGPPLVKDDEIWNLKQQVECLEDQVKDANTELEKSKKENARLQTTLTETVANHTKEITTISHRTADLTQQLTDAKNKADSLHKQVSRLQAELQQKNELIETLTAPVVESDDTDVIAEKDSKIAELLATVETQRSQMNELRETQASLGSHKKSLVDVLAVKEAENEKYRERIKDQESKYARLLTTNRQHQDREKQFQQIVKQLNDAHMRLKLDFNSSLQEGLAKHVKALKQTMAERDGLKTANDELRKALDELSAAHQKLHSEIQARCDKVIALELELEREKDQTEAILMQGGAKDPKALRNTIETIQLRLDKYMDTSTRLKAENTQLHTQVRALERQSQNHRELLDDVNKRFRCVVAVINSSPGLREAIIHRGVNEADLTIATLPPQSYEPPSRALRAPPRNFAASRDPFSPNFKPSTLAAVMLSEEDDVVPGKEDTTQVHKPRIMKPIRGGGGKRMSAEYERPLSQRSQDDRSSITLPAVKPFAVAQLVTT